MIKNTSQLADHADPSNEPGIWIYDIETYPNYFLAVFKRVQNGQRDQIKVFEIDDLDGLKTFLSSTNLVLIGYNNFQFDDVILKAILDKRVETTSEIASLADRIITSTNKKDNELKKLTYYRRDEWNGRSSPWICIDLLQILGGSNHAGSLKSHEVRLALPNVQDLPFKPGEEISTEAVPTLIEYCKNDVYATEALYYDLEPDIEVRQAVNQDYPFLNTSAFCRSNPYIAEEVIKRELETKAGLLSRYIRKPAKFIFDPSTQIAPDIAFQTERNQQLLHQLRALGSFNVEDWVNMVSDRFLFHVGQHKIGLGEGGVHTIIPHMVVESENIAGYDVSSYYPCLIRRINRFPSGLTSDWLDIINGLTEQRLTAKAAGDIAKAGVFKIIINSIYGKLKDPNSISRDESLQLAVVLNGQLFLIMLMEAFHVAGFEVISANTDGVYINASNRLSEAREIADQWMAQTGFTLEEDLATKLVAASLNEYALYAPQRGWYHRKGRFSIGKRIQPPVITEAILEHFSSGEDIETLVRKRSSVLDFLYSSSIKGNNVEEIRHGNTSVQRTNRWYRAIDGFPIEKQVLNKDESVKWVKVPNSDSCRVVNVLESFDLPEDLDFDHYIGEAKKLCQDILANKPSSRDLQSRLIANAIKAQSKGLIIVPKGREGNEKTNIPDTYLQATIQYWRETPLDEANWGNHLGFGAYTGPEFNLIALDIDYLDKAKESGLFDLISANTAAAWHGEANRHAVLSGDYPGTLLFYYNGPDLRTSNASFLLEFGFEILYGEKVVQLAGPHPNGDKYQFQGKPKKLPKKLLNFLSWKLPGKSVPDKEEQVLQDAKEYLPDLVAFQEVANADLEYRDIGGALRLVDTRRGKQLEGLCIGHRTHTNRQGNQNMRVFLRNGEPKIHCFHQSCWSVRSNWLDRIQGQRIRAETVHVKPENTILTGRAEQISIAMGDPTRHKLVVAPTGSGKTHAVVVGVCQALSNETPDKYAIICSSKDQMAQIAERFAVVLEVDNVNQFGIDLIESTGSMKIRDTRSRTAVRDGTQVAITHFTYVSRRGFSEHYYAFLKYIDENTHVIIDEVDAFIESQTTSYPLGSRKRRLSRGGLIKNLHVNKCGMFHQYNNCTNCLMRRYDGHRLNIDDFRNLGYVPVGEYMEGTQLTSLEHIDFSDRVLQTLQVGTSEVTLLEQKAEPGDLQFDSDDAAAADFKTIFNDHLDGGYLPTVHRPVILYDDEEITRDEFIAKFGLNHDSSISDIPDEERRRLRFPSRACNVLTVTTIDRRPLLWMAKAKSLTTLTATISDSQTDFLAHILEGLMRFDIAPQSERRMDQIIVIGMVRRIPAKMILDGHLQFNKMFRYRETQKAAERDFEALRRGNISLRMGYDRKKFMLTSDENDYGSHKILQTYAFSSLGRGVDFASYDLVDINASIYKPICAYVTDDPEALKGQLKAERVNIIVQNVGRILRKTDNNDRHVKIVLVECLEEEAELNLLVEALSEMSEEPIASWWVPDFLSHEEVCEHISKTAADKVLPNDLPKDYEVLKERAEKLIAAGEGRTGIKKAMRWQTVRKKLTAAQASDVEETIDRLLQARKDDPERMLSSKDHRRRERRQKRIKALKAQGLTKAQIRSRMRVTSGKSAWSKIDQEWFDKVAS